VKGELRAKVVEHRVVAAASGLDLRAHKRAGIQHSDCVVVAGRAQALRLRCLTSASQFSEAIRGVVGVDGLRACQCGKMIEQAGGFIVYLTCNRSWEQDMAAVEAVT